MCVIEKVGETALYNFQDQSIISVKQQQKTSSLISELCRPLFGEPCIQANMGYVVQWMLGNIL